MSLPKLEELAIRIKELEQENLELRRARDSLQGREEQYRLLAENVSDVIWMRDMNLQFTYLSPSVEKLTGYSVEEAMKLPLEKAYTQASIQSAMKVFWEEVTLAKSGRSDGERSRTVEMEGFCKDGSRKWTEAKMKFLRGSEGQLTGILGVSRDITERKRAQKAHRQSEERYRSLVENTMDGYFICRIPFGRFVFLNQRICELYGYTKEEGLALTIWDVIGPEERERVKERIQGWKEGKKTDSGPHTHRAVRKDGTSFQMEVSTSYVTFRGEPVVQGIIRDVTERETLQRKLLHAQKMESIGTLAGGIAHDFNNLLMAIQGNVSLLLYDKTPSHPDNEYLKNIEKQVKNAAKLTSQLLGYAGKGRYEVKVIDLNALVKESIATFERIRRDIRIHRDLADDLPAIEGEEAQLEQVLMNLFVNGSDAMPEGGDFFLRTRSVTHKDMTGKHYRPEPGNYVELTVADTGEGMDPETQAHIFEPFFTTKEMGRGTGLGLASVYGIMKAHKGYVNVDSKVGCGTTFRIYLPASEKRVAEPVTKTGEIARGQGTILLVDDEESVLTVGVNGLEKLGYSVLGAKGGKEALEIYKKYGDEIDMVILDMIMPGMGGGEVYDRIRALDPRVKVLLSSGYSIEGQAAEIVKRGCQGFIQKPFSLFELSAKIKELLKKDQS